MRVEDGADETYGTYAGEGAREAMKIKNGDREPRILLVIFRRLCRGGFLYDALPGALPHKR